MKTRNHNIYLDILKIIACIFVIIDHANVFILNNTGRGVLIYHCLLLSLSKIGVPIFIMVSGALLLKKDYSYKKIIKCVLRVLIPMLIIMLLIFVKNNIIDKEPISFYKYVITNLEKPQMLWFWYIYMLIGLYIATPFLQKMIKAFKNIDYKVFIIFFLIVPAIFNLLKVYFHFNYSSYIFMAVFPIVMGYYIAGDYFANIKLTKKGLIISIISFAVAWTGLFLSMYLPVLSNKGISDALNTFSSLPAIIMSLSFFYIIRYLNRNAGNNKVIAYICSLTFGIYLTHGLFYVIMGKSSLFTKLIDFNPFIGIVLLELSLFLLCGIITAVVKILLKLGKIIRSVR